MGVFLYLSPKVPLSWFSDPGYYEWGLLRRIAYQIGSAFTTRWKYYFIWSLAEASMILSGLGFSGWKDSQPKWDRAINVQILQVELATSAATIPVYWNISVSTWLRHCILTTSL
jgi:lysophospholipid acyltransferase